MFGQRIRFLATNGRHHVDPEFEFNLFLEDRKEDVQKNISPALKSRKVVIMDRYYFSNICYQGALGLDVKIIQRKNEEFAPKPDLVILLDVSPRVGISRITKIRGDKTNHFEKERYLSKVKKLFDKLDDPYVQRISSVAPIDDVQMEVQNASLAILRRYAVEEQKNTQRNLQRIRRSAR
jgi:dTMP kinase